MGSRQLSGGNQDQEMADTFLFLKMTCHIEEHIKCLGYGVPVKFKSVF